MKLTKEQIMEASEEQLWKWFIEWLWGYCYKPLIEIALNSQGIALSHCYQAEEKIRGMGKEERYAEILEFLILGEEHHVFGYSAFNDAIVYYDDLYLVAHASPKQRCQAMLLTICEEE